MKVFVILWLFNYLNSLPRSLKAVLEEYKTPLSVYPLQEEEINSDLLQLVLNPAFLSANLWILHESNEEGILEASRINSTWFQFYDPFFKQKTFNLTIGNVAHRTTSEAEINRSYTHHLLVVLFP